MEHMTPVDTYRWGRARLLEHATSDSAGLPVPACPGWRVRDVVAHVTGIAADFRSGRLPAGDVSAWTAEQVASRRDAAFADVVSEWEDQAPRFEAAMAGHLSAGAPRFAADVVSHSFDVAAAVGVSAGRTAPAVEAALATFVDMLGSRLDTAGGGRVEVRTGGRVLGAGRDGPLAVLTAEPFEALRVLSGRRTGQEIRRLDWQGDLDAVIDRISPFPLPASTLGE